MATAALIQTADATRNAPSEIPGLTGVRALAALDVVLLHTLLVVGGPRIETLPSPLLRLISHGAAAVSFFFVLSGFILTQAYSAPDGLRGSASHFWRARFARIYPLYAVAFLLDAPRAVSFFISSAGSLAAGCTKTAVAALAYLGLVQAWHPRVTNAWNTPGWSLSVEAFFYAIFPWFLAVTRGRSPWRLLGWALAAWALPVAAYVVLSRAGTNFDSPNLQTFWRSFPILRLPEFALGVAAGRLHMTGAPRRHFAAARAAGLVALALIVVVLAADVGLPETLVDCSLAGPLYAVVIVALANQALPLTGWLDSPSWRLLGKSSYAVYIVHVPFMWWFLLVTSRLGVTGPSPGLFVAYLLVLQIVCVALFVWVEDPARRAISRLGPRREAAAAA